MATRKTQSPVPDDQPAALIPATKRLHRPVAVVPPRISGATLPQLQRLLGNRTVSQMLARQGHETAAGHLQRQLTSGKLNIVGETHEESMPRRAKEKAMLLNKGFIASEENYWTEAQFTSTADGITKTGDDPALQLAQRSAFLIDNLNALQEQFWHLDLSYDSNEPVSDSHPSIMEIRTLILKLHSDFDEFQLSSVEIGESHPDLARAAIDASKALDATMLRLTPYLRTIPSVIVVNKFPFSLLRQVLIHVIKASPSQAAGGSETDQATIGKERSLHMLTVAQHNPQAGVWKVGDRHVQDILGHDDATIAITSEKEFNTAFKTWEDQIQQHDPTGDGQA